MLDLYCERLGPGLWAEPINTTTNLAFFISAWVTWRMTNQLRALSVGVWLLIGLIGAIGMGSGLFHVFATHWARVLDAAPILLFQLVYVWLYCRRIVQMRFESAAGLLAAYVVAAYFGRQFPHLLNGSLIYAPAAVALLALGIYHCGTRKVERFLVLNATGVFFLSITFRTIDIRICSHFPIGSHFLWHIFNAVLLYLLMRALLANLLSSAT
jgi:hypothetical protein